MTYVGYYNTYMTEAEADELDAKELIASMGWRNEVEQDRMWQRHIAEGMSAAGVLGKDQEGRLRKIRRAM